MTKFIKLNVEQIRRNQLFTYLEVTSLLFSNFLVTLSASKSKRLGFFGRAQCYSGVCLDKLRGQGSFWVL
jgi:hypothetical protein